MSQVERNDLLRSSALQRVSQTPVRDRETEHIIFNRLVNDAAVRHRRRAWQFFGLDEKVDLFDQMSSGSVGGRFRSSAAHNGGQNGVGGLLADLLRLRVERLCDLAESDRLAPVIELTVTIGGRHGSGQRHATDRKPEEKNGQRINI